MSAFALALTVLNLLSAEPPEHLPPSETPRISIAETLYHETRLAFKLFGCSTDGPTDRLFVSPPVHRIEEMLAYARARAHREYIPEAHDCEDASREYIVLCKRWAIENMTFKDPVSLTIFSLYVEMKPGALNGAYDASMANGDNVYHAVNVIRDADGVFWVFDAQTGVRVRAAAQLDAGLIRPFKIIF